MQKLKAAGDCGRSQKLHLKYPVIFVDFRHLEMHSNRITRTHQGRELHFPSAYALCVGRHGKLQSEREALWLPFCLWCRGKCDLKRRMMKGNKLFSTRVGTELLMRGTQIFHMRFWSVQGRLHHKTNLRAKPHFTKHKSSVMVVS